MKYWNLTVHSSGNAIFVAARHVKWMQRQDGKTLLVFDVGQENDLWVKEPPEDILSGVHTVTMDTQAL